MIVPSLSLLLTLATSAVASRPSPPRPASPAKPNLTYLFTVNITTTPSLPIGTTPMGNRQFAPITGGSFSGPRLQGEKETNNRPPPPPPLSPGTPQVLKPRCRGGERHYICMYPAADRTAGQWDNIGGKGGTPEHAGSGNTWDWYMGPFFNNVQAAWPPAVPTGAS